MSIVVDSSVWIDFFNGQSTAEVWRPDSYLSRERIIVGDLVLCDVLPGFRDARHARHADQLLGLCEPAMFGGEHIARLAADHCRTLGALGISIRKTIDLNDRHLVPRAWCHAAPRRSCYAPLVTHLGLREA